MTSAVVEDAILGLLKVFGPLKEEEICNLLTIADTIGIIDAGPTVWGVTGFHSKDMVIALQKLVREGFRLSEMRKGHI